MVAQYDGVFKGDGPKRTNVADSAADGHRITKTKRREVLDRTGCYERAGADLNEVAKPPPSGTFAGQAMHYGLPARLSRPASNIQILSLFKEQVGGRAPLQIDNDFRG